MVENDIIPNNERERINALLRYQILDTPPEGAFDRITALLSQLLDMPIAIASLVDTDRIWFKSHHGVDVSEITREPGLCSSAILSNSFYILSDARFDPRSSTNPLVTGKFGLRFYAAVPLKTHDNYNLGALCCIDFKPRTLTKKQIGIMESLAQVIMDQMELRLAARRVDELHQNLLDLHEALRIQAAHDSLTNIWNRSAIMELLNQTLERSRREQLPLSVMILDIDFFKRVNDTYGHLVGDEVLIAVAQRLQQVFRNSDFIGRLGGEEFLCVMYPCDIEEAKRIAERCRQAVCAMPILIGEDIQTALEITISGGFFSTDNYLDVAAQVIIKKADDALYISKQNGRNRATLSL
ncbi:MAG TPA: sensor domain-containing diguanylate cyclase [Methylococcales bacterium]|jgi:diguanylate cyclase (GGDEF)-like protein